MWGHTRSVGGTASEDPSGSEPGRWLPRTAVGQGAVVTPTGGGLSEASDGRSDRRAEGGRRRWEAGFRATGSRGARTAASSGQPQSVWFSAHTAPASRPLHLPLRLLPSTGHGHPRVSVRFRSVNGRDRAGRFVTSVSCVTRVPPKWTRPTSPVNSEIGHIRYPERTSVTPVRNDPGQNGALSRKNCPPVRRGRSREGSVPGSRNGSPGTPGPEFPSTHARPASGPAGRPGVGARGKERPATAAGAITREAHRARRLAPLTPRLA